MSIGEAAFKGCTSLTSINIPNSVTNIGNYVFSGCTNFTIYCEQGSYAETYAKEENIPVKYTDVSDIATKQYVDSTIGDIDTALDNIIAIQNELLGISDTTVTIPDGETPGDITIIDGDIFGGV